MMPAARVKPVAPSVARVKARMELSSLQSLESAGGKAEQIGFWEVLAGNPAGALQRLSEVAKVSVTDVLRAARRYLRAESRSVILVRPSVSPTAEAAE